MTHIKCSICGTNKSLHRYTHGHDKTICWPCVYEGTNVNIKRCGDCGYTRPLEDFYNQNHSNCKFCKNLNSTKGRKNIRDKRVAIDSLWGINGDDSIYC